MLEAFYYDGTSARRHRVRIGIREGLLMVEGDSVSLAEPLGQVDFGESLAGAPRCIEMPGGGRCEVPDQAAMAALLASAGIRETLVGRIQGHWRWAVLSLAIVVATGLAGYFLVLPEVARRLAPHVPAAAVRDLSDRALQQLDGGSLWPSRLPQPRQDEIRQRAAALLGGLGFPTWRLHFRSAPRLGPNALTLPGGDIVLLDELVARLQDDRQIDAVIAHEVGHLVHHHAMRQLIQDAALSVALAAWFGDVSSAAAGITGLLLKSSYSRSAEQEADAFAARQLLRCCNTSEPLVEVLLRLEDRRSKGFDLLHSHPDERDRILAIRQLQP